MSSFGTFRGQRLSFAASAHAASAHAPLLEQSAVTCTTDYQQRKAELRSVR